MEKQRDNPAQQFLHIVAVAAQNLEQNTNKLHRNLEQAVQSLPFARVAGIKALPAATEKKPLQILGLSFPLALHHRRSKLAQPPSEDSSKTTPPKPKKSSSSKSSLVRGSSYQHHDPRTVCIEYTKGKRRLYKDVEIVSGDGTESAHPTRDRKSKNKNKSKDNKDSLITYKGGFEIADDTVTHHKRLTNALADYLLPQGYPDSVEPHYAQYMGWRGVQYFFGGAMSVFTTRSLLGALGVANRHSGEAAAAINWVVKDGAGRLGRFLFARWGRSLDCELKQFRLAGDFLMEAGAALELSTALMPKMFLPLACTANLAKNLAAVAASSTRAPIYRNFARQNNLADITAKGESVANLADILGTAFGIALAKANLRMVPTFCVLSIGYLLSSRKEVDSVELPYLNRARLSYAARSFLDTGILPTPAVANTHEALLPWNDPASGRVVLGATVEEACTGPGHLHRALDTFQGRHYALTYRSDTNKVYIILKQAATTHDILQAAVDGHAVLYMMDHRRWHKKEQRRVSSGTESGLVRASNGAGRFVAKFHKLAETAGSSQTLLEASVKKKAGGSGAATGITADQEILQFVASNAKELHRHFEHQAKEQGWKLPLTMLNPLDTRLAVH